MTEAFLSLLLPPPGAYRGCIVRTQGVASLRSLALGWELVAPSGRWRTKQANLAVRAGRWRTKRAKNII